MCIIFKVTEVKLSISKTDINISSVMFAVCTSCRGHHNWGWHRIHGSDQECAGCLSILLISEVVSMALVKTGDSVLMRLAHQRVSMVLAEKSRIPSFICASVSEHSNGGLDVADG